LPLPPNLTPYRSTPVFTAETIPAGLLRDHNTKAGVWGLIHVTAGVLLYRILETGAEHQLTPETPPGVVEPEQLHSVEPLGAVTFYVEFWH
jgi:tellurite resistance-related uncharacterized protein